MSKQNNQDSLDSDFDTRAQGKNSYKPRNGGYENYETYGGYRYYDEVPKGKEEKNGKRDRNEKRKKSREQRKSREQNEEKKGGLFDQEGEGSKILKNIFSSLSKVMDTDDKTSSILNVFSNIFKGGSVANVFSDIATKENKPVIQLLDTVLNQIRGGALPYENLVANASVLKYFLDSDIGRKMLPNIQFSSQFQDNSNVDTDRAKKLIKALEKEIAWKNSIGGKLDKIRDEPNAEKKISLLASIYMDGDNPVEDAQNDKGILGVLYDIYGGKYKFAEGATFNVVPPSEMRNQFMEMIKNKYHLEKKGSGYLIQDKKDFKERAQTTAKSVGEKLGGFAQIYSGGNPDNLTTVRWYYSLLQIFPLAYLFVGKDGQFCLPEGWKGWVFFAIGTLLFISLFIFGFWGAIVWLYKKAILIMQNKKSKNEQQDAEMPLNKSSLQSIIYSYINGKKLKNKKRGRGYQYEKRKGPLRSKNGGSDSD